MSPLVSGASRKMLRLNATKGLWLYLTLFVLVPFIASAENPEPVSERMCNAKRVLLKAHNAKTSDRARAEIRRINQWEIVASEADNPDLILQFDSGDTYSKVMKGGIRLIVLEAKTGEELWRDHQRTLFWRDTTSALMRRLEERCPEWKEGRKRDKGE